MSDSECFAANPSGKQSRSSCQQANTTCMRQFVATRDPGAPDEALSARQPNPTDSRSRRAERKLLLALDRKTWTGFGKSLQFMHDSLPKKSFPSKPHIKALDFQYAAYYFRKVFLCTGASTSGKSQDFDSCIRRFEPSRPSHILF